MTNRLIALLRYLWWGLLLAAIGCSSTSPHSFARRQLDKLGARASFACWNMKTTYEGALRTSRCECAAHQGNDGCARALELASRSRLDLDSLLRRQPAPSLTVLHGKWCGINKGFSAAIAGITQDIKVFQTDCGCPSGYNLAVHQVPISALPCRGFQSISSWHDGEAKLTSRFKVMPSSSHCKPLALDYSRAENSCLNPAGHLYDELVMIDENLLLGRANLKVGNHLTPLAYFVLFRNCE